MDPIMGDPIVGATNTVPLQQPEPAVRPQAADPAANAPAAAVDGGAGPGADAREEQFRAVAASFVSQMYLTIWREAQRNAG